MSKPRHVVVGAGAAAVTIEYLRARRVLRLSTSGSAPVEVTLAELIEQLGIEAREVAAPNRYLLFAGRRGEAKGGASDLVGSFASEPHARQAFHQLQERRSDLDSWAELTALDHAGRLAAIGWFGTESQRSPRARRASDTARRTERPGTTIRRPRRVKRFIGMTIPGRGAPQGADDGDGPAPPRRNGAFMPAPKLVQ